ncbi:MAG TPA: dephospho-CoA kinase [Chitinophagaceae bacterium]|nr:dephospho-CoA kinase [Chitinophagaceae bacterium]
MLKVGITGGIGSGKSTVCRIFSILGVPVYHADARARFLMQSDPGLKESLLSRFGKETYKEEILDRDYLASRVFGNPGALSDLNALVHPAVIRDAQAWFDSQNTTYVIKEAALLFESGAFHLLDLVIGVSAPQPLRVLRAMKRDGKTREEILRRMKAQIPEEMKMLLCQEVLFNDERQLLIPQVLRLHQKFLSQTGFASRPGPVEFTP